MFRKHIRQSVGYLFTLGLNQESSVPGKKTSYHLADKEKGSSIEQDVAIPSHHGFSRILKQALGERREEASAVPSEARSRDSPEALH